MVELPEEPTGPDAAGDGGGGGGGGGMSSLLHGVGLIKSITALVVALTALITALNQLGVFDRDGGTTQAGAAEVTTEAATTEAATTQAATTDAGADPEFSDPPGLFQPAQRPLGRAFFDGGAMFVTTLEPGRPFVHVADADAARDVRVSVSGERVSGARDFGMGLVCRHRNATTYYLASVLSGGRYNVVRYGGGSSRSLTNGIQSHDGLAGDAHELTLRCVGSNPTILTFSVDGRTVREVTDAEGLPPGTVGVRVGSGEAVVTVRFTGFTLRGL